ncbi:MAG: hypothetical protein CVV44_05605 [Spirochaetae bacterium HGW-Spirochaetae-1]|jgi:capsular polysaccharide biosynthesis protein/Mrp family chromosome partitioning ATPase|nr:MAG: hypothetical protein CVV44_05605 [Spirochaetae bacterium HGW-Spirochaetae-1]
MEKKTSPFDLSVKGIVDIIFRHKMIIVIAFIINMIFTMIGIQFITPVYDANVKMLIRGQSITAADTYTPIGSYAIRSTQAQIVQSYPVLKRAVIALDLHNRPADYETQYCSELKKMVIEYRMEKAKKQVKKGIKQLSQEMKEEMKLQGAIESLKSRLKVSLLPGTDIIVVNVTAFTPEEAIETANVISRSYTIFDQMQQLAEITIRYGEFHPTVVQIKDNIRDATNNLSGKTLSDIQAIGNASVKIIEQATSDNMPVSKPKRKILSVGLLAALFISFGLAFVVAIFDRTIKSPQDVVVHLNVPCIGSIPVKQRNDNYLITEESPDTRYSDFYEELAEQFYVFLKTQGLKAAVITSPLYGNNHKYIVPNLGYLLSDVMKHKVLLIDANFHNPSFQEIYKLGDENGNDNTGRIKVLDKNVISIGEGIDLFPVEQFNGNLVDAIKKIDLKEIVKVKKADYDAIVIDATSVKNMKEAARIAECGDGTVIIIDEGKLKIQMIKNSLPRLRSAGVKILGGILNERTFPIPEIIYRRFKYFID